MPLVAAVVAGAIAALAPARSIGTEQAACAATPPAVGGRLSGPILQVVDGQTFCVALGPTPDQWVKIQLADTPHGDRAALMDAAFAQRVTCVVLGPAASGAVAARCIVAEAPAEARHALREPAEADRRCLAAD
jgi:hypothetical protein